MQQFQLIWQHHTTPWLMSHVYGGSVVSMIGNCNSLHLACLLFALRQGNVLALNEAIEGHEVCMSANSPATT